MKTEIMEAVKELYTKIKVYAPDDMVRVDIGFTFEGYTIETVSKNPDSLKDHVISMKNLKGEWIK